MNYTIMGNAVNIASRLEGLNKMYGTWVLVSEDTIGETRNNFLTRRLDRVRPVGIHAPIQIYELVEFTASASEEQRRTVELFHEALDLFEKRDWNGAEAGFQRTLGFSPGDSPSRVFLDRCKANRENPPSPDWDGVFDLKYK
jgi:adenylate cyclase